ncbi:hypothetical protein [Jatrophihabitans sp.]|uniref:hypothetical protein n=1 Tax=Jatrophihabitans sp. TaxID=1932789 RepID=UPI002BCF49F3|nr:hypothetical protein [Jatrophihabitans sp.]
MLYNGNGELARLRHADLIREAQHHNLVRDARSVRTPRPRHLLAVALHAAAHRIEPRRARFAAETGIRPEPCAISPC